MTHPLWDYTAWQPGGPLNPYGDEVTYRLGLGWLDELGGLTEDWGAGLAYGRRFVTKGTYRAVDSSPSSAPFVDHVEDLRWYTPPVRPDGIFIRHVLEHNTEWSLILANALEEFRRRMVLVIFTPWAQRTHPLRADHPILDISFRRADLAVMLNPFLVAEQHLTTNTQYGGEHVFYCSREKDALGQWPATPASNR